MSLNWNLGNVKDHRELCFAETPDGLDMKRVTEFLIWATMVIGMDSITEKNQKEFYTRLTMVERLFGAWLVNPSDGSPRFFTPEDVESHIGLTTNADQKTDMQFLKYLLTRARQEFPEKF